MYQFDSFADGYVLVTHTEKKYRARFRAADEATASKIVCDLNLPAMLERLAAHRYEVETQGVEVGDITIKSDPESQAKLHSAYNSLKNGLITTTKWKGVNGWQTVDLAGLEPIAQAVASHVAQCFDAEESVELLLRAIEDHAELAAFDVEAEFDSAMEPEETPPA